MSGIYSYAPLDADGNIVIAGGVTYQGANASGDGADHVIEFAWDAKAGVNGRLYFLIDGVVQGALTIAPGEA